VDFWTGKRAKGGQRIMAEAPLDRIPIYVVWLNCRFWPASGIGLGKTGSG